MFVTSCNKVSCYFGGYAWFQTVFNIYRDAKSIQKKDNKGVPMIIVPPSGSDATHMSAEAQLNLLFKAFIYEDILRA